MGKKRFCFSLLVVIVLFSVMSISVFALTGLQSFCDFTSERCVQLENNLDKLQEKYPHQILIERFHYSEEIDENIAFPMIALECSRNQERYGAFREKLYTNTDKTDRDDLKHFARQIGLTMSNFSFCLDARLTEDKVANELAYAEAKGVTKSPSVIVEGKKYEGIVKFTNLDKILQFHLGLRDSIEDTAVLLEEEIIPEEEVEEIDSEEEDLEETCYDGLQNQDEQGVDCGGVCAVMCVEQKPMPITFESINGEKPINFFPRIAWNIKKFFWSISK